MMSSCARKAPILRDAVAGLAECARVEGWTHEPFLAACLQREVAARESHGGEVLVLRNSTGVVDYPGLRCVRSYKRSGWTDCLSSGILLAEQWGRKWRPAVAGLEAP